MVGNQRGGARDLAIHLMKDENENVQVHEIRGFIGQDLQSAFQESYAISRGTKCKQHLFSLSLNPPPDEDVETQVFEEAIERVEKQLGLSNQPRAIVFHEKYGDDGKLRRHAHAVWCRIDTENMKAIQLSFSHTKLNEIARELYIEHDWKMPRGFINKQERDPRNFTLAEWQQAKRTGKDVRVIKTQMQDSWAISDSKASFAHALNENGLILAKGDRGFVAVDFDGEVYSISKWVGIKTKQVHAKLGELENLPSVEEAHNQAAKIVTDRLHELSQEQESISQEKQQNIAAKAKRKRENQKVAQQSLTEKQAARQKSEEEQRQAKLRKGLLGFLDRFTGRRRRTLEENKIEALRAHNRDYKERLFMQETQRLANEAIRRKEQSVKSKYQETMTELQQDIKSIDKKVETQRLQEQNREAFKAKRQSQQRERPKRKSSRSRSRDGPGMKR